MITAAFYPAPNDSDDYHDSNSAIIVGDRVYAYEEEKLTGTKNENTVRIPERSFFLGCKQLGIEPKDVDRWVFSTPYEMPSEDSFYLLFTNFLKAYSRPRKDFAEWFAAHVVFVPHHVAHASVAVHASGFDDCLWLTIDAGGNRGDARSATWGESRRGVMVEHDSQLGLDGLGSFHNYLTEAIGFAGNENGKTSGLAPYGTPQPELEKVLCGLLEVDGISVKFHRKRTAASPVNLARLKPQEYNRTKVINSFPSPTNVLDACLPYLPQDIAATGEKILRDMVIRVLETLQRKSAMTRAVFSGGLFQNVALNRAIVRSGLFEETYFPMASTDGGLALGAALSVSGPPTVGRRMTAFLGPSFDENEVVNLCDRFRLSYAMSEDPSAEAAALIAGGSVVGWFQGRGEYGPRSLGARSILADPRNLDAKTRINQLLKRREWFMPYAPAVLEEALADWFTPAYNSPYMQVALDIVDGKRDQIPAAVHVDGTCRAQVVNKDDNPAFWALIDRFRDLTGIPVVLNTSFNRHGIATISTPRQAVEHLLEGCMDHLFVGRVHIAFADNRLTGDQDLATQDEGTMLLADCERRLPVVERFASKQAVEDYKRKLKSLREKT